jgi:hypothetical protein
MINIKDKATNLLQNHSEFRRAVVHNNLRHSDISIEETWVTHAWEINPGLFETHIIPDRRDS